MSQEMEVVARIGDARYSRPFYDQRNRPMVQVYYDDGDRFVTYAVPDELLHMLPAKPANLAVGFTSLQGGRS